MGKRKKNILADGLSVAEHARILRSKPGWNPQHFAKEHNLSQTLEQLQVEQRLSEQTTCPDCKKAQEDTGDPQALCHRHYALVLGFET